MFSPESLIDLQVLAGFYKKWVYNNWVYDILIFITGFLKTGI